MRLGPLAVLHERNFRLLWSGMIVSDIGTWMQIAALGIYVAETTGKASWVGLITTATYLAVALFSPFGGTLADRHDRRRVIAIACLVQAALSVILVCALITGHDSPLLLWLLAGLQGSASAAVLPTQNAMVPDLVPREMHAQATSLFHVSWNAGRSIGPLLAVVVIAIGSYETVFLLNGLSYLGVAFATTRMAEQPRHHSAGNTFQHIRDGVHGLRTTPECRLPFRVALSHMTLVAPFLALVPAMAQLTLHGTASDTGRLFAAQGIGSMLGVLLIVSLVPRLGQLRTLSVAVFASCGFAIAYAMSPNAIVAMLLILPLSGFHSSVLANSTALVAGNAPPQSRGRLSGIYSSAINLAYAVSSAVLATAADHFGLRVVLGLCAGLMLVGWTASRVRLGGPTRRPDQDRDLQPV